MVALFLYHIHCYNTFMEFDASGLDLPIDPYKLKDVIFVSYEVAGFTMDEIKRLIMRGFEVQCFKIPGEAEEDMYMNFPVLSGTPAERFNQALTQGLVGESDARKFLSDARYVESDTTFNLAWSDYV
jgi:hypothetical protein